LKDAPSQCGAFCLAALRPLIDKMAHNRLQIDGLAKAQEETKNYTMAKLSKLPTTQELEKCQNIINANLESTQNELSAKHKTIEGQLAKMETILQSLLTRTVPKFQKINSKYLYVENHIKETQASAEQICRQMGAHLASPFHSIEILNQFGNDAYWVGRFISSAYCIRFVNGRFEHYNCLEKLKFICETDRE